MTITLKQIQRFQKYFNIVEEIHTITHNAIDITDEALSDSLKEQNNLNKTFAKTNRDWYRHKNQKSYGFVIDFGGKPIQQVNTTEDIVKFIENAMESEIIKGYLNHYVQYNKLNHNVNVTKTAPFEWTCTIDDKQFYVDLDESVYILNHKERFETPENLVKVIFQQLNR